MLLLFLGCLAVLASAVSYDFSATDPADDVLNGTSMQYGANPPFDILSVVASEKGTEVEVRLILAGPHSVEGYYSVTMGDGVYQQAEVIWSNDTGFLGHDILGTVLNVSGRMDSGGNVIVWLFAKSQLLLEADLDLISAYSYFNDLAGILLTDTVDADTGPEPEPVTGLPTPDALTIYIDFVSLDTVEHSISLFYRGDNALALFYLADVDNDAVVSTGEIDAFEARLEELFEDEDGVLMTYNGRTVKSFYSTENARGFRTYAPGREIEIAIDRTFIYPNVSSKRHTYVLNGLLDPPEGLEYWNVSDGSLVNVYATFDTAIIPPNTASSPFLSKSRGTFLLEGVQVREKWNETAGSWDKLELENIEFEDEEPNDTAPGFEGAGTTIALTAVVLLIVARRRRGSVNRGPWP